MFIHKSIDMQNTRCNIELGKDRYVQATECQAELRIHDREWETKNWCQSLRFLPRFPWQRVATLTVKLLNQGLRLAMLKSSHWKFYVHHHDLINRCGKSASHVTMEMLHMPHTQIHPFYSLNGFMQRATRRVPQVGEELRTRPEHLSSPQIFSGVRVAQSLIFRVVFC